MAVNELCSQHSGFESRMETLEKSDIKQWEAIDRIMNRPPVWTMAVFSLLTFLLGAALTYASLAVHIAELAKIP